MKLWDKPGECRVLKTTGIYHQIPMICIKPNRRCFRPIYSNHTFTRRLGVITAYQRVNSSSCLHMAVASLTCNIVSHF